MLMPKRVKHRKQFRGRMKGKAYRAIRLYTAIGVWPIDPSWLQASR